MRVGNAIAMPGAHDKLAVCRLNALIASFFYNLYQKYTLGDDSSIWEAGDELTSFFAQVVGSQHSSKMPVFYGCTTGQTLPWTTR
jgi:hypothetical protein